MTVAIQTHHLPYTGRLELRETAVITLAVIHCTELPDLATARIWGEREIYPVTRTGNSGHYYVDRDGSTHEWVPIDRVANHVRGLNPPSIGIELVNAGRYPDWFHSGNQQMTETYPRVQIEALATLLNWLHEQLPGLNLIAGHADLDTALQPSDDRPDIMIRRKQDPGPLFPWHSLMPDVSLDRITSYQSPR